MAKYHGKGGRVMLATTTAGEASALIRMTSWTLNMTTAKEDATDFDDTNITYVQGLPDTKGSLAGFWDDTNDSLYDASRAGGGVKMYLYPNKDVTTKYFYGRALVDFNIEVDVKGVVRISGDWAASDSWGQM